MSLQRIANPPAALTDQPITRLLVLIVFFSGWIGLAGQAHAQSDDDIRRAVVQVRSTTRGVSLASPWRQGSPRTTGGSGVLIGPKQILTNAHVVLYATSTTVTPFASSERISAKVKSIAPGIDLAILELEEPLPGDPTPLELGDDLPEIRSTVQVFGYPTGGDSQSVTEGIVSRIDYVSYKYRTRGLRVQIDAALNPGNSGGPAVIDGKIAGLAYALLSSANDIGYIIPAEEIRRCLADFERGESDNKARLWISTQSLRNTDLRQHLNLDRETTGVLYKSTPLLSTEMPLQPWDVITHIGEHAIDNMGRVRVSDDLNFSFYALVPKLAADGTVPLTVLREGQTVEVDAPVSPDGEFVVAHLAGRRPTYFVYGPLVFSVATADYMESLAAANGSSDARARKAASTVQSLMAQRRSPLITRRYSRQSTPGEQMVIMSKLLPHESIRDYSRNFYPRVIGQINGRPVRRMTDAVEILRTCQDEQLVIEFQDAYGETLVLNREAIEAATDDVLEENSIVRRYSADLADAWKDNGG